MTPPSSTTSRSTLKQFESLHVLGWVKCFACWLFLAQWISTQSLPWIIDTISQSTPSSKTGPTYMETSTHGSAGFRSERGLPVFGGELFTCSLYNTRMVFDNIRSEEHTSELQSQSNLV